MAWIFASMVVLFLSVFLSKGSIPIWLILFKELMAKKELNMEVKKMLLPVEALFSIM